jgi:hypothetical protein
MTSTATWGSSSRKTPLNPDSVELSGTWLRILKRETELEEVIDVLR